MSFVHAKRKRATSRLAGNVFQWAAMLALASCVGDPDKLLEHNTGSEPGAPPEAKPATSHGPDELIALRRLTHYEYANTVHALLSVETEVDGVAVLKPLMDMAPVDLLLDALPQDGPKDNSTLFDATRLRTDESHVLAYFQVANLIAEKVASTPALYTALTGQACREGEADKTTCVRTMLSTFGARALRRPLSSDEQLSFVERYKTAAVSGHADGLRVTVASLLNSPSFIFHLEDGGTPVDGDEQRLALTPFEKASRLSFALTGAPPDAIGRSKAESGALNEAGGFAAEVDRVLALPSGRQHIKRFFKQWLKIPDGGDLTSLNADFLEGVDATGIIPKLSAELHAFIDHVVWQLNGGYTDLLTSRTAFITDPTLAKLYGVQAGTLASPAVELPATRAGLLTRGALLLGLSEATSPISRGVRIRRNLLCDRLGEPVDINVADTELKPLGDETQFSTRQVFEHRTSLPRCQSCHISINGLGFGLEGYDTIGRFRTTERRYNAKGERVATLAVDSKTLPLITSDAAAVSQDAVQLSQLIASSDKAPACLIKQWIEYSQGSHPSSGGSSDSRDRVQKALTASGGGIARMIRQSAVEVFDAQKPL